jgi:hypothetical protein
MKKDGIKLPNHIGTWYEIDSIKTDTAEYYLLQSEQYGDEAAAVVVNAAGEELCETFDDIETALEELDLL